MNETDKRVLEEFDERFSPLEFAYAEVTRKAVRDFLLEKLREREWWGKGEAFREMREAFLSRGADKGSETILWNASQIVKVMNQLLEAARSGKEGEGATDL